MTTTAVRDPRAGAGAASTRVRGGRQPLFLAACFVICGIGVVLATSRFGIGLTPDSVTYVSGATNLADGNGYTDFLGREIGVFPPGYSAVLAVGDAVGLDVLDWARLVSVASLAVSVALAHVLLRRHVRSQGVVVAATVVVACSAVLLEVYSKALSEHLFVPVVLAFVLAGERLVERPADVRTSAALVLLTWAAFALRYAGIVMIGMGAIVHVVADWSRSRRSALARASLFVVASSLLPIALMIRNERETGNLMGSRSEASASLTTNVKRASNEVSQWLATQLAPPAVRALVAAVAVVLVVAGIAVVARRRERLLPGDWRRMVPLALFTIAYVSYLVVSASIVAFAAINTRFMLPVYIPAVVMGAWAFERVRDRLPRPEWRKAFTIAALAWVVVNVGWFAGRAVNYAQKGAGGYASEYFHDSEILSDVDRLDLSVPTFSNDPYAIALFLDKPVRLSVARTAFASDSETGKLPAFVRTVACAGRAQLVWFRAHGRRHLYTPEQLAEQLTLRPIVERGDGIIYELGPRPGVTPACRG